MRRAEWRVLIRDCIRFYHKRGWDWVGVVGYLCHCALGETIDHDRAAIIAEALRGLRYRQKDVS